MDTNLYFLALTFFVAAFHVSTFITCLTFEGVLSSSSCFTATHLNIDVLLSSYLTSWRLKTISAFGSRRRAWWECPAKQVRVTNFFEVKFSCSVEHTSAALLALMLIWPCAFAVLWRCFSTLVIFLYLLDEQTSLLVLIPAGIGSLIEVRPNSTATLIKKKKQLKINKCTHFP